MAHCTSQAANIIPHIENCTPSMAHLTHGSHQKALGPASSPAPVPAPVPMLQEYGVSEEDQRKKILYNLKDVIKKDDSKASTWHSIHVISQVGTARELLDGSPAPTAHNQSSTSPKRLNPNQPSSSSTSPTRPFVCPGLPCSSSPCTSLS